MIQDGEFFIIASVSAIKWKELMDEAYRRYKQGAFSPEFNLKGF